MWVHIHINTTSFRILKCLQRINNILEKCLWLSNKNQRHAYEFHKTYRNNIVLVCWDHSQHLLVHLSILQSQQNIHLNIIYLINFLTLIKLKIHFKSTFALEREEFILDFENLLDFFLWQGGRPLRRRATGSLTVSTSTLQLPWPVTIVTSLSPQGIAFDQSSRTFSIQLKTRLELSILCAAIFATSAKVAHIFSYRFCSSVQLWSS